MTEEELNKTLDELTRELEALRAGIAALLKELDDDDKQPPRH